METMRSGRNHVVHAPAVEGAYVHVLDEAEDVAPFLEVPCHVDEGVVVHAALDDGVDLYRRQADALGRLDALEHRVHAEVASVHLAEDLVVEAVEADGDPMEPGVLQRLRHRGEQVGVGRHRQVFDAVHLGKLPDEGLDALAHQRLAARQPDLHRAQIHEDTHQPHDLLEGQQFFARQEAVALPEYLGRHTVRAAEVAAVRHGDADIPQRPVECVLYGRR